MRISKKSFAVLLMLSLSACAQGAKYQNMVVHKQPSVSDENFFLKNSISLENVTGGKSTNPLWMSKVSNEDFQKALVESLKENNLLNEKSPKYALSVELQSLKQPFGGLDLKVESVTGIKLTEKATSSDKLAQTIRAAYTAGFSDSLYAPNRLRLANEGSIKENIKQIISALINYKE